MEAPDGEGLDFGRALTDFSQVDVLGSRYKSVNFGVVEGLEPRF